MLVKTLAIVSLFVFSTVTVAQTGIVFHSADGKRIGELVNPSGTEDRFIKVLTTGNYLMTVDMGDGAVITEDGFKPVTFWTETENCNEGQWFLKAHEADVPDWIWSRGGQVLPTGVEGAFVAVEWGRHSPITAMAEIHLDEGFCTKPTIKNPNFLAVRVQPLDVEERGIHLNNNGVWGFDTPFTVSFVKSELIACSGFESCPAGSGR